MKVSYLMKKLLFISISLLLIFVTTSFSQYTSSKQLALITQLQRADSNHGQVQIIQDKRIDSLMVRYVARNYRKQTMPGFRIRIFSANNQDNGRQRAYETKAKFISAFQGVEAYVIYETPDWKVLVGDFRSRTDAFHFKKQIDSMFPNNRLLDTQIDCNKL